MRIAGMIVSLFFALHARKKQGEGSNCVESGGCEREIKRQVKARQASSAKYNAQYTPARQ